MKWGVWAFIGLLGALIPLIGLTHVGVAQPEARPPLTVVWPLSGNTIPDLPQSSAYGPRLKASEGFRYDYHQGIDLPTPISTTLLAVTTGTVRIAGSHPGYSDGVVQLDHGNDLYSNYLHVSASLVTTDQVVHIGQPVALSGASASGFPHLHFELRLGSVFRADAVNPWRYLPYTDTISHTITISQVLASNAVWAQVMAPAHELDVNQITLTVCSLVTQQVLDSRLLDYEAHNKRYNGNPALLDDPDLDSILIQPRAFNSTSSLYVVDFKFHDLAGIGPVKVEACALDLKSNRVCATQIGDFLGFRVHLPLIVRQ